MTIFEEILSLLSGSPELHAYLLARPEQLLARFLAPPLPTGTAPLGSAGAS